ncbi:hypothetical protein CERZMDRAFT_103217 [Cercospora zeae-maydis SCOH1-5]|uniref:Uncharacterized protein n=1 Tax=Cercospora zeae-maydis SCOH1-5 TaxID=717836 RepID=A0A6A6EZX0_9PEZI|nr:hypothetical protein CERZMDRAFT_103217 [Cercospora zeae-maydis SCOH1-5]
MIMVVITLMMTGRDHVADHWILKTDIDSRNSKAFIGLLFEVSYNVCEWFLGLVPMPGPDPDFSIPSTEGISSAFAWLVSKFMANSSLGTSTLNAVGAAQTQINSEALMGFEVSRLFSRHSESAVSRSGWNFFQSLSHLGRSLAALQDDVKDQVDPEKPVMVREDSHIWAATFFSAFRMPDLSLTAA